MLLLCSLNNMTRLEHLRSTVALLHRAGKSTHEIAATLKIGRRFVQRAVARFVETGSNQDRPRSGRPPSARTPQLKKKLQKKIQRNPERSMRKMALECGISERTVRRVVHQDLQLKSLRKQRVQLLSSQQRQARVERCRNLIPRAAAVGWDKILWSDEKIFTVQQATNAQNCRVIASDASAIPSAHHLVQRAQKPASVMVWCGVSAEGRTDMIFIPPGCKVNAKSYQELVLSEAVVSAGQQLFDGGPWLFVQDGAPAHTAKSTQQWLQQHDIDFVEKAGWPPSSPDLNPLDFCIWAELERRVCCKPHRNVESLKRALLREWARFPQSVLRESCLSVDKRMRAVIRARGGHIECD